MTRFADHHSRLIDEVQALVAALRARDVPQAEFSVAEAARLLGVGSPRAQAIVRRLRDEGLAVQTRQQAGTQPARWQLVAPTAPDRAVRGVIDHMWTAIRKLPSFTVGLVLAHVQVAAPAVSEKAVREYVRALLAAGYLRVLEKARPGVEAVYRLKPGHGSRTPRLCRVAAIVDPNTNTTTLLDGGGA